MAVTPLILVPGHMCAGWLYEPQLKAFPEATLADVTRDDSVQAMAESLLENAPERFAIAGLSLGAMVAMEVMARAPERVGGACLMATDPGPASDRERDWRAGLWAKGQQHYVERFVGRFYRHDEAVAGRLGTLTVARMLETPEPVARAQAAALDTRRDMLPLIAGYRGPVEIVCGAEDTICPAALHTPLAEALPGSHLVELPGCGHIATLEAPEACTAALDRLNSRISAES